ncbi:hypothetical protein D3C71_1655020 [compost metagenome]
MPSTTPATVATTATTMPTSSDTRAPQIVREYTSRPSASVPKKCSDDGGFMRAIGLMSCGSTVASQGAASAIAASTSRMAPPTYSMG